MKHPLYINSNGKLKCHRPFIRRPYPVMDRAVEKARQRIMQQEDERIFQALDSIFQISGNNEE